VSDREATYGWLLGYAECLGAVVPSLDAGEVPDEEFLARCQDFDTRVRQFDVALLREALATPEGRRLTERLQEARAKFAAAMDRQIARIDERRRGLGQGRTALRGYAEAGAHQRAGPLYLEKAL